MLFWLVKGHALQMARKVNVLPVRPYFSSCLFIFCALDLVTVT